MSRNSCRLFGAAIVVAVCTGCMSGSSTSGGLTTGLTTGAPPPSCESPCGQHANCTLSSAGAPVCQCDESYTACPVGEATTACIQLQTDPRNCNACGNQCPPGQQCATGICACPMSSNIARCETDDGGFQCVDLTSDGNCGACDLACGQNQECAAVDGGPAECVCQDGGPGVRFESCAGVCTNTNADPFNCGGCSVVCFSGSCFVGDAGTGVCSCPAPNTSCGQDCVDLNSDPYHCGSCDMSCVIVGGGPELVCAQGHCLCGPTGRGALCPDGTCALLSTDPQNCGQCGTVCVAPAETCVDGGCASG
jgi:hypothetical protein